MLPVSLPRHGLAASTGRSALPGGSYEVARTQSSFRPWHRTGGVAGPACSLELPTRMVWRNAATAQAEGASAPDNTNDTTQGEQAMYDYGVASAQGPRELMEDCAGVVTSGQCGYFYALVFDGHNGGAASEWLRDKMYDVICKVLMSDDKDSATPMEVQAEAMQCPINLQEHLGRSFVAADKELLRHLEAHPDESQRGSGSTATVALVRPDKMIIANVGDSRAVLCRKGRAKDLTQEHRVYGRSPVAAEEVARIEAGGGWVRNGRVCDVLAVSRTFGDPDFKGEGLNRLLAKGVEEEYWDESFASSTVFSADPIIVDPDVVQLELEPEDDDEFLIVATDGLWDVFSSEEAVSMIRKQMMNGLDAQGAADKLVEWALKRYTPDNVAAIVIDLGIGKKAAVKNAGKKKGKAEGGGLFGGLFGR